VKLFFTDHFELPLPAGHRFPIAKYGQLRQFVSASSWASGCEFHVPDAASDQQLCLAHSPEYVRRVATGQLTGTEIRRIGFPWSLAMVERSRRSVGATIAAGRAALDDGVAANLAGGTHHASADAGEGFCVFNDVAVAARTLQHESRIRRAVVIDCDVHQGNGTASIFADDPSVFTFSIHGAKNFPLRKSPGDLDVALPDGTGDDAYLQALDEALDRILVDQRFDLAFYLAGADPFEGDRLGRMQLTKRGLRERDRRVLTRCRQIRLPAAVVMAGGYAHRIEDIVEIHAATIRTAIELAGMLGIKHT
jgi:acetoin utilization deacetylase AcuC-like enzyme